MPWPFGPGEAVRHPEHLKFNPGGAAIPRGGVVPKREKQYIREEAPHFLEGLLRSKQDAEWYDDMMEKRLGSLTELGIGDRSISISQQIHFRRFPGYMEKFMKVGK